MNLQQLRFVQETARHNFNLTHAAQAIGTSQPALSRGILELEAELGVDIFVRHGKRMLGLTEPGKAILARAQRVLAEVQGIERVTADFRARDAGELRIATTHTQARYVLPSVIREFRKRYPAVRLTLVQGNPRQITQSLLGREVDFAIATEVSDELPEILTIPAFEWEHVVVVPNKHPLLEKPLTLQTLVRYPIITYVEEFTGRRRIDKAFADAGLEPDIVLAAIDSDVIKTYVALGLGVGIMADLAYDAGRDRSLTALPAGSLFGVNHTRLAVRRDAFLRGFALTFIELFAPAVDRKLLERLMRKDD
ncbi:CysB family HTH-type transcriptional regulator [Quisquiliibacterium transsilvanicum]|uniref:LysR family cys regulon transcriptional activator n=1 Tax=Quisquiliibacterium transsilvanicum TaxID=1549638 RepID=A0A7W8HIW7_9BURK|nr:CysB family HTH-type transcriptional regulator [Quisquiliibacterium transsilvanicum]MBB5272226.1 LysR family cys regulon transcriptional activator [Quisquiliibacterium transsilvanicum]